MAMIAGIEGIWYFAAARQCPGKRSGTVHAAEECLRVCNAGRQPSGSSPFHRFSHIRVRPMSTAVASIRSGIAWFRVRVQAIDRRFPPTRRPQPLVVENDMVSGSVRPAPGRRRSTTGYAAPVGEIPVSCWCSWFRLSLQS